MKKRLLSQPSDSFNQQAASLRACVDGPPPRVCPGFQAGWGLSSGSAPGLSGCVCGLGEAGSALRTSALVSSVSRRPSGCPRCDTSQNLLQARSGQRAEHGRCAHVAHFSERPQSHAYAHQAWGAGRAPTLSPAVGAHAPGLLRDERVHPCRACIQPGHAVMRGVRWVNGADSPLRVSCLWVTVGVCRQVERAHRAGFQVPSDTFQSHAPV